MTRLLILGLGGVSCALLAVLNVVLFVQHHNPFNVVAAILGAFTACYAWIVS